VAFIEHYPFICLLFRKQHNHITMVLSPVSEVQLNSNFYTHEFERALVGNEKVKPYALYIERCRTFMETPPPEKWTGERIMTEK
jgi:hypothetical protein